MPSTAALSGSAVGSAALDLPLQLQEDADRAAEPALVVDRSTYIASTSTPVRRSRNAPIFRSRSSARSSRRTRRSGFPAAANDESRVDELPDEGAHGVGCQVELLGHFAYRAAGAATQQPHQLELGSRQLRQLLGPPGVTTPAAAYGAHRREQLVRQKVEAVVGPGGARAVCTGAATEWGGTSARYLCHRAITRRRRGIPDARREWRHDPLCDRRRTAADSPRCLHPPRGGAHRRCPHRTGLECLAERRHPGRQRPDHHRRPDFDSGWRRCPHPSRAADPDGGRLRDRAPGASRRLRH